MNLYKTVRDFFFWSHKKMQLKFFFTYYNVLKWFNAIYDKKLFLFIIIKINSKKWNFFKSNAGNMCKFSTKEK